MLAKTVRVVLLVGAVLFFANLALAKTQTINLRTDVVLPDGQTLKAGEYAVVVDEKADQVQFLQGSVVVVTHRCKCVVQETKNLHDAVLILDEPGKPRLLQEIRFHGETRIITLPS